MRYIPNTPEQQQEMLHQLGLSSLDDLFSDIPKEALLQKPLDLPESLSESELLHHMESLASRNENLREHVCFLGAGAYDHFVPLVIDHILSREEFFTSYTPYQPEMSQGTLQAIFEYQSMICELTGMEVSNASMYDGATALAEAAVMACTVQKRRKILVSPSVDPQYRKVLATYGINRNMEIVELPLEGGQLQESTLEAALDEETAAVVLQSPNFFGSLEKIPPLAEAAHENGALCIVSTDLLALALTEAPGNQGADLVTGNGQSAGNGLLFGGPHFGFFAATQKLMRKMPGRIAGETVDKKGRRGYVLTLQAPGTAHPAGEGHLQHLFQPQSQHHRRSSLLQPHGAPGAPGSRRAMPEKGSLHPEKTSGDGKVLPSLRSPHPLLPGVSPQEQRGRGKVQPASPKAPHPGGIRSLPRLPRAGSGVARGGDGKTDPPGDRPFREDRRR